LAKFFFLAAWLLGIVEGRWKWWMIGGIWGEEEVKIHHQRVKMEWEEGLFQSRIL